MLGSTTKAQLYHAGRPVLRAAPGAERVDLGPQGGTPPYGLYERQDDWSSCAYVYLDRPTNDLPPLARAEERIAELE